MSIIKRYSNGEVTVVWKPDVCMHSERCFHGLPQVFDPRERPWVRLGGTSTQAIVAQVEQCPSGALSWERDSTASAPLAPRAVSGLTKVTVTPNGPLLVHGDLGVTLSDGTAVERSKVSAFCRCGQSANKPFCDGSHKRVGFVG